MVSPTMSKTAALPSFVEKPQGILGVKKLNIHKKLNIKLFYLIFFIVTQNF